MSPEKVAPALERMSTGALRTLLEGGLTPDETMDLIPVKPLAEHAPAILAAYRERLARTLRQDVAAVTVR